MDLTTALDEMLAAIGAANDDIAAVLQIEPGHWAVGYDDDVTIEIECANNSNRLTLFCGLGVPKASEIDRIRHTLLCYNMMWRETGGMRMGLSGAGDEAFLIGDVYLPDTSEASLDQALWNMAQLARAWTRFITEGSLVDAAAAIPGIETMIRI